MLPILADKRSQDHVIMPGKQMAHRTSTRSEVRLHSVVPISYLMHNNTHAAVSKSSPDQSYHFPHHLPHPVQSLQTRRSKRLIFVICNQRSFSGCKYPVKITPDFFPLCFFACCIGYICTQMNKYKKKKKKKEVGTVLLLYTCL